jgi:hypothetical protein
LWSILESVKAVKIPDFDFEDYGIPYWYKKFDSEKFDKVKINRTIQKLYQEKGDDTFWWTLREYYDYFEEE